MTVATYAWRVITLCITFNMYDAVCRIMQPGQAVAWTVVPGRRERWSHHPPVNHLWPRQLSPAAGRLLHDAQQVCSPAVVYCTCTHTHTTTAIKPRTLFVFGNNSSAPKNAGTTSLCRYNERLDSEKYCRFHRKLHVQQCTQAPQKIA